MFMWAFDLYRRQKLNLNVKFGMIVSPLDLSLILQNRKKEKNEWKLRLMQKNINNFLGNCIINMSFRHSMVTNQNRDY